MLCSPADSTCPPRRILHVGDSLETARGRWRVSSSHFQNIPGRWTTGERPSKFNPSRVLRIDNSSFCCQGRLNVFYTTGKLDDTYFSQKNASIIQHAQDTNSNRRRRIGSFRVVCQRRNRQASFLLFPFFVVHPCRDCPSVALLGRRFICHLPKFGSRGQEHRNTGRGQTIRVMDSWTSRAQRFTGGSLRM